MTGKISRLPDLKTLDEEYIVSDFVRVFSKIAGWILLGGGLINLIPFIMVSYPPIPFLLFSILGSIFLVIHFVGRRQLIEKHLETAKTLRPPHKVIDDFIHWERGDELKLKINGETLSFGEVPKYFMGTLDDGSIVLMDWKDPDIADEAIRISPDLLNRILEKNQNLSKRLKVREKKSVEEQLSESKYEEFRKKMKREYEKISDQPSLENNSDGDELDTMRNRLTYSRQLIRHE